MGTVTGLTAEKMFELVSGWDVVAQMQSDQAAIINQLQTSNGQIVVDIDNLNNIVIPQINANLASNDIALDNLNDNVIPQIQTDLDLAEADIAAMNSQVDTITTDITNLQTDLNTLNTVTIPQLQSDLDANTSAINTLNTVTIPDLQSDLDANTSAINTLNTVTIPDLQSDLDTGLNNLQGQLTALDGELGVVQGKFPITGPDIAANAIESNHILANAIIAVKIAAGAVVAGKIAADAVTANEILAGSILADKIATNAVTADKIIANAINSDKIAANAVVADKIATNAVTADKIIANAINSDKIAANAIISDKIAANAVTADKIVANAISADKIVANAVTGDKIAANTVQARNLLIQGENLLSDPSFESGVATNHNVITNAAYATAVVNAGARTGTYVLRYTLSAAIPSNTAALRTGGLLTDVTTSQHPRVSPGDVIFAGFWVWAASGSTVQARAQTFVRAVADPNTNVVTSTGSYVSLATGWNFVSTEVTVPSNASDPNLYIVSQLTMQGGVSGEIVRVDDMIIRERMAGSLILDGTLTAAALVALTITGDKISANTIQGDKIVANSVNADRLVANSITATQIAALTISGDKIAANAITADKIAANTITGDRITATFTITGKTIKGGTILGSSIQTSQTANTGPRMEMNEDSAGGFIKGFTDDAAATAPTLINPKIVRTGATRSQSLYLSSGTVGGGVASVELQSGSVDNTTWEPRVIVDARLDVQGALYAFGNIRVDTGQTLLYESYIGGGVTGASVNNAGAFIRTGSNRDLKDEISPLSLSEALKALAMEPVSFVWKDTENMGDARQAGFIAEQADLVEAELWVTRDKYGNPSGVRYPELTAAHNLLIKHLIDRIEVLEALLQN